MHKVLPAIKTLNENEDIPLGDITVFSLYNKGTIDIEFGFGDTWETLREGQTISYEAGANTVFDQKAVLKIRFGKKTVANDFKHCSVSFNRLVMVSPFFKS